MIDDMLLLWTALVLYLISGIVAIVAAVFEKRKDLAVFYFMAVGLVIHTAAITWRWVNLGHGPFITQFEILSSNIWSLLFIFSLAYVFIKPIRPVASIILPLMFIMMGWLLLAHPGPGFFPPTYQTIWMYIHIFLGKIFLGSVLIAVGLSIVILLRYLGLANFKSLPNDKSLDELSFRFMALGLIFDSLMLVAGAIWAQDAWGRYWAWDSLESWSFLTWVALVFAIHMRLITKIKPHIGAAMVLMVFMLAFFTFFGVPFVSDSTHKGAV